MANAASSLATTTAFISPPLNQLLNQITTIKLDCRNYLLWKNLALPILKSYKLEGHLTGDKPCPEKYQQQKTATTEAESSGGGSSSSTTVKVVNPQYESWNAIDQLLLGWLYNSMAAEVATQVLGFENEKDLWGAVQELFGIQSQAEVDYFRQIFQQTHKVSLKMAEYLQVMKTHTDNLGQAGSVVDNRSLVSQVLLELDQEFNPIIVMIQGIPRITWSRMQ